MKPVHARRARSSRAGSSCRGIGRTARRPRPWCCRSPAGPPSLGACRGQTFVTLVHEDAGCKPSGVWRRTRPDLPRSEAGRERDPEPRAEQRHVVQVVRARRVAGSPADGPRRRLTPHVRTGDGAVEVGVLAAGRGDGEHVGGVDRLSRPSRWRRCRTVCGASRAASCSTAASTGGGSPPNGASVTWSVLPFFRARQAATSSPSASTAPGAASDGQSSARTAGSGQRWRGRGPAGTGRRAAAAARPR